MKQHIPLAKPQREIMGEFYRIKPTRVIFDKRERKDLWSKATKHEDFDLRKTREVCPALVHQIERSYDNGDNIQSAVFSECVYAQTLANMFGLIVFVNCYEDAHFVPDNVLSLLHSYNLVARYAYSTKDKRRMLIEAGGHGGIDSALLTVIDLNVYTIEFKEPYSKTSEPDLPSYTESGRLRITDEFITVYPQFKPMLAEQKGLNFFDNMGHNINDFSDESIQCAVNNNYVGKKFADVICTEDKKGYLVMMPSNQVSVWAKLQGEIRPSGRNNFTVWTPLALERFLSDMGGTVQDGTVSIALDKVVPRKERGGDGKVSGYKINPLFFVRIEHCTVTSGIVSFDLRYVRQLKPTIAAKMDFRGLEYTKGRKYYIGQ